MREAMWRESGEVVSLVGPGGGGRGVMKWTGTGYVLGFVDAKCWIRFRLGVGF